MSTILSTLLLLNCVYSIYAFDPQNIPLCIKGNSSCSYLFGEEYPPDFCKKIYYNVNEQPVCDAAYDENAVRSENINLGRLILQPFYGDSRTVFNMTFVDIKFMKLKVRFQEYINGFKVINSCMVKDFILNGSVPSDKSFSYVCPWSDSSFEGNEVDFHYEYGLTELQTRTKLRYFVPKHELLAENVNNIYFFTYVDYTDTSNLVLKINPPENRFNVTEFKIEVIYTFNNESNTKTIETLTAEGSNLLEYSFYTAGTIGDYHFRVTPTSNHCETVECVQETPKIRIEYKSSTLLIGMVGISILIPIFMIITYMWTQKWPGLLIKPNVLLVTVPTNDAHILVAPIFAEFLRKTYNINVFLDVNDVPKTKSKKSSDWLEVAIHHASHIIFLRSNDNLDSSKVIYQDNYLQTIHLLNPKLNSKKKECIVTFPYSSLTTEISHPELIHIRKRFNFKKDCNKLIKFLINKNVLLKNKDSTYQKLLEAIKNVENEKPVNRNNENVFVEFHVSDDDDNNQFMERNIKNVDAEKVIIDLNIDEYELLGEQDEQDCKNVENNSDSDLDIFDFLGNEENV